MVSHRHRDHLEGFSSKSARTVIESLRPDVVLRPWVDQPDLADNATSPSGAGRSLRNRRYAQSLWRAQKFANEVASQIDEGERKRALVDVVKAAEESLPNRQAINELNKLAAKPKGRYLHYGMQLNLAKFLPGVSCDILGPPTIDQWPAVQEQRESDKAEFGLSHSTVGADSAARIATANAEAWKDLTQPRGIGPARWVLEDVDAPTCRRARAGPLGRRSAQ